MLTLYNYVTAFYSVVLVSCVQPVNWASCVAVHQWFPPYVTDLERFIRTKPYKLEQNYLSNFDKNLWRHISWGRGRSNPHRGEGIPRTRLLVACKTQQCDAYPLLFRANPALSISHNLLRYHIVFKYYAIRYIIRINTFTKCYHNHNVDTWTYPTMQQR